MKKVFGESRDYVPRSNSHLLEEFAKSVVWQDMQSELNVWLTEIRDLLESGDEEIPMSAEITGNLRGSAKAIRHILLLPETLAENIRLDNKRDQKEKDNDEGN